MSDLWEHKVGMSLPTLPFPFLSPFFLLPLPVAFPPPFLLLGSRDGADCLSLPSAIIGHTGHAAGQEITFKLGLEAVLEHGYNRSVEIMGLRMVCVHRPGMSSGGL